MKVPANTPQFVLATTEFGFNLMIADPEKTNLPATDEVSEAMMFSVGYDNAELKRGYWSAITGYNLEVVLIKKVEELKGLTQRMAAHSLTELGSYTCTIGTDKCIVIK